MPVTFQVANHPADPVKGLNGQASSANDLLTSTWGNRNKDVRSKELLQSSFSEEQSFADIRPTGNGFVTTVLDAYNLHHHLVLR